MASYIYLNNRKVYIPNLDEELLDIYILHLINARKKDRKIQYRHNLNAHPYSFTLNDVAATIEGAAFSVYLFDNCKKEEKWWKSPRYDDLVPIYVKRSNPRLKRIKSPFFRLITSCNECEVVQNDEENIANSADDNNNNPDGQSPLSTDIFSISKEDSQDWATKHARNGGTERHYDKGKSIKTIPAIKNKKDGNCAGKLSKLNDSKRSRSDTKKDPLEKRFDKPGLSHMGDDLSSKKVALEIDDCDQKRNDKNNSKKYKARMRKKLEMELLEPFANSPILMSVKEGLSSKCDTKTYKYLDKKEHKIFGDNLCNESLDESNNSDHKRKNKNNNKKYKIRMRKKLQMELLDLDKKEDQKLGVSRAKTPEFNYSVCEEGNLDKEENEELGDNRARSPEHNDSVCQESLDKISNSGLKQKNKNNNKKYKVRMRKKIERELNLKFISDLNSPELKSAGEALSSECIAQENATLLRSKEDMKDCGGKSSKCVCKEGMVKNNNSGKKRNYENGKMKSKARKRNNLDMELVELDINSPKLKSVQETLSSKCKAHDSAKLWRSKEDKKDGNCGGKSSKYKNCKEGSRGFKAKGSKSRKLDIVFGKAATNSPTLKSISSKYYMKVNGKYLRSKEDKKDGNCGGKSSKYKNCNEGSQCIKALRSKATVFVKPTINSPTMKSIDERLSSKYKAQESAKLLRAKEDKKDGNCGGKSSKYKDSFYYEGLVIYNDYDWRRHLKNYEHTAIRRIIDKHECNALYKVIEEASFKQQQLYLQSSQEFVLREDKPSNTNFDGCAMEFTAVGDLVRPPEASRELFKKSDGGSAALIEQHLAQRNGSEMTLRGLNTSGDVCNYLPPLRETVETKSMYRTNVRNIASL